MSEAAHHGTCVTVEYAELAVRNEAQMIVCALAGDTQQFQDLIRPESKAAGE